MDRGETSLTLSCIGAGRAGKTLCRLFAEQQSGLKVSIEQIINRSKTSAEEAIAFIGQGRAEQGFENLSPANIWLIATPDNAISAVSESLSASGVLRKGDSVFHCSGSLSSKILSTASDTAYRASVHPIHSFANPENSLHNFSGSTCAIEGDQQASAILTELFSGIGGHCFALDANKKALYHAATVMASNNLVSLLSLSQQLLEAAGVHTQGDENILQSLAENSLNNYFNSDGVAALTGPISRGDNQTIEAHLESLKAYPDWLRVYTSLGAIAIGLAEQQGYASSEQLQAISSLLDPIKKNKN